MAVVVGTKICSIRMTWLVPNYVIYEMFMVVVVVVPKYAVSEMLLYPL